MPEIEYGKSAYARNRGSMPDLPLVNLFPEQSPVAKQGVILQSRKGLSESFTVGDGPIRASWKRDGVLSGKRFTVSGSEVYADTVLIGSITGSGPVSIDGDTNEILIAAGGPLYRWNGTTFGAVTFPDGANVRKVVQLAGYFIAARGDDTYPQRWYFSAPGDGSSWDGLDFATAENEPDRLLDVVVVNDSLTFLGSETVEFWVKTGDADLPFVAIEQRLYRRGIIDTGAVVAADNSIIWVADDKIVYRGGNVPEAISPDGIVERLVESTSWSVFLIEDERHKFVCIRLDAYTMAYDITTGEWCEFASYGRDNFRGRCADSDLIGDDETGSVWEFSGYTDASAVLERRLRGGFPVDGGIVQIDNVRIRCEVGQAIEFSGDYENPEIEMRMSNDYGRTWTDWEQEPLGEQGASRTMPEWRALGIADYPGALFEWRYTAPTSFRFSGAVINEPHGGRQR